MNSEDINLILKTELLVGQLYSLEAIANDFEPS